MYAAHRLDISLAELAFALRASVDRARGSEGHDGDATATRIERAWSPAALVCLSVRSAFDLLLHVCAWPPGSEAVFSAVNMPDMARIATAHGVLPVPADLDARTLVPSAAHVARALSPRTRAIVVAQLFGARVDLAPFAAVAKPRGLLLIEDCAQGFHNPADTGDPHADVSLFSFGSIKTATALGGALVRVESPVMLARMRAAQSAWPRQLRSVYRHKVLKYVGLVSANGRVAYEVVARACALAGRDVDDVMRDALRGFASAELLGQIRQQPSAALLAVLERRLTRFDATRLARRAAAGAHVARHLPEGVAHAGGPLASHTHWVFPVRADAPDPLIARLRRAGFHASRRGSNLAAIAAPSDRPVLEPLVARALMDGIVFLPAYPEMPTPDVTRMLAALRSVPSA